ncbi:class I SAM-dependent methyltransferase [Diaminobutyricibacter sp. McL0608]|uniref:class I SAM-dependent methyltransferase n=1 Tax=Leifsonia sp. McL0608 TaxID=3143537 RepID=UPI0031F31FC7
MDESPSVLTAVGRTAVAVALARALESERPQPWFDDRLAQGLARYVNEARQADNIDPPRIRDGLRDWVAVRTRFLDELLLDAVAAGDRQIVVVGAGLDARAFRLPLGPDVVFFEVDRTDVVAVKERMVAASGLKAQGSRRMLVGDVTDPGWLVALAEAGLREELPTVWVLEGFLVYFEPEVRTRLLQDLASASAPGSRLGATVSTRGHDPARPLWHAFAGVDFVEWFAECGWDASVTTMGERSLAYGRALTEGDVEHRSGVLVDARRSASPL